jgi:hypothetical protein
LLVGGRTGGKGRPGRCTVRRGLCDRSHEGSYRCHISAPVRQRL